MCSTLSQLDQDCRVHLLCIWSMAASSELWCLSVIFVSACQFITRSATEPKKIGTLSWIGYTPGSKVYIRFFLVFFIFLSLAEWIPLYHGIMRLEMLNFKFQLLFTSSGVRLWLCFPVLKNLNIFDSTICFAFPPIFFFKHKHVLVRNFAGILFEWIEESYKGASRYLQKIIAFISIVLFVWLILAMRL